MCFSLFLCDCIWQMLICFFYLDIISELSVMLKREQEITDFLKYKGNSFCQWDYQEVILGPTLMETMMIGWQSCISIFSLLEPFSSLSISSWLVFLVNWNFCIIMPSKNVPPFFPSHRLCITEKYRFTSKIKICHLSKLFSTT